MIEDAPAKAGTRQFKSRLASFLQTVRDDLDIDVQGGASAEEPAAPPAGRSRVTKGEAADGEDSPASRVSGETEASGDSRSLADDGATSLERDMRRASAEAELAQWKQALAELNEQRSRIREGYARRIEESYAYIRQLNKTMAEKAAEIEEAEAREDSVAQLPERGEDAPQAPTKPKVEPFSHEDLADYEPPSLDFLRPAQSGTIDFMDAETLEGQKDRLQQTFDNFSVDAFVCDALVGPRVTQFRVRPGYGVRVGAISNLEKNIALSMSVNSVRIQAPIPGEPFVGVEVPNPKSLPINLRTAFDSRTWRESSMELPVVMGMDITGHIQMCDLAKAPHMLIAGATGSGKSVCINNLIMSLVYNRRPDELELVLVDPKKVEFAMYKDMPHLIHPLVDDPKQAFQALKWLVREMEGRYTTMADKKVRNLAGYNAKAEAEGFKPMPHIVLIIDELADLMMTAQKDIETQIARLAQMSRAVGIHTVLATQRPSVNVITGIIKANYPTRAAFRVSSLVDSRTILDSKGAESLQGRGDMLYNPPGADRLMRLQSPYVDDEEILRITDHLRAQANPRYRVELRDEDDDGQGSFNMEGGDGLDPLLKQAVEIVATSGKASTSYLQRRLKIGYNRAANLIEELEDRGYIGPQVGQNPREILVEPGEFTL